MTVKKIIENSRTAGRAYSWIILLSLVVVWGSSFILMKKGLEYYSHTQLALMRISIACLVLLPFALRSLKEVNRKNVFYIALAGIIGNGIPAFLFAKAQTHIDSSLAGILNSLTPLFVLVVGLLFFGYKARWLNITGVFVGLAGTIGLMSISGDKTLDFNFSYGVYVIIATMLYAINVNIIKRYLDQVDALTITSVAFLIIGIPFLLALLLTTDFITVLNQKPGAWEGLGYIAVLGAVGSGLALIFFNKLIKMAGVLFSSSVTYLMPVVALLWGVADGEAFHATYLLWIGIILLGVFMANFSFREKIKRN